MLNPYVFLLFLCNAVPEGFGDFCVGFFFFSSSSNNLQWMMMMIIVSGHVLSCVSHHEFLKTQNSCSESKFLSKYQHISQFCGYKNVIFFLLHKHVFPIYKLYFQIFINIFYLVIRKSIRSYFLLHKK